MDLQLKPADIFLTKGPGFISKAIRFFTRTFGESRTRVNHVGLIVSGNDVKDAIAVEALSKVLRHKLWGQYGPPRKDSVAIYRPINLTHEEVEKVTKAADDYVGRKYGVLKIVAHFLDWLLQGMYVFRRLTNNDNYPICSWVVAHAFKKAEKYFGVDPGAASPDDIWDFVTENKDKYACIYPLDRLR
jgi:hypothetical protein